MDKFNKYVLLRNTVTNENFERDKLVVCFSSYVSCSVLCHTSGVRKETENVVLVFISGYYDSIVI